MVQGDIVMQENYWCRIDRVVELDIVMLNYWCRGNIVVQGI